MRLLAYGEFDTFDPSGMFRETFPFFMGWILTALLYYAAATLLVERPRYRELGILLYIALVLIFAPKGVMGAYGPAHVGMEVGWWAYPLLLACLVGKVAILRVGDIRRSRKRAIFRTVTFPAS